MREVSDYSDYLNLIGRYNRKNCLSNDYIQKDAEDLISAGKLYIDEYNDNLFIFVNKEIGQRLYYYINNLDEYADFANIKNLVIEILFRGNVPEELVNYFISCGFRTNLIRDQYAAIYKDLSGCHSLVTGINIRNADSLEEVSTACMLFNESFDHLSGDFISESDYGDLLHRKSIIIALDADTNQFLGALHVKKEGKVIVLGHVAVVEFARGRGVGRALVDAFVDSNMDTDKTRYQLWVQRQNKAAVNMYLNKGFKYVNKSTISLIK